MACAATLPAASAWARKFPTVYGVPLPPGSYALPDGRFASGRGFRDTVRFFRRELPRAGYRFVAHPVARHRDITYARFLAQDSGAPFRAVHVVLANGRTTIYVVPAD